MTDFLTSLAARALAPPTLRPRTPSRFEPVAAEEPAGSLAAPPAPPRLAAPPQSQPAPARAAERPEPPPRRDIPVHEQAGDMKPPETAPRHQELAPETIERTVTREVPRDRVEVVEKPVERIVEKTTPARVLTERVEAKPRVITERVETPAPAPGQPRALPHRHDAQPPRVITREERRERTVTIERERERERTFRTTVEHERILRSTSGQPRGAAPQPASSEPVVQVSIGRIEVRAVTQPEPRQRQARKPPMSIDDYVARRDGKERR